MTDKWRCPAGDCKLSQSEHTALTLNAHALSSWRDHAHATFEMPYNSLIIELIDRAGGDAAERRIAAALACHTRTAASSSLDPTCRCGYQWDIVAHRCTSPTVTALLGVDGRVEE